MEFLKSKKNQILLSVILTMIAAFIAFAPSLNNKFVEWDDKEMLLENDKITSLSPGSIKTMFTASHYGLYHPLVHVSYAIEHHYFGFNPVVYHWTNLILHLANATLVFCFIYLLSGNILIAFITGLIFGIHPLQVESVAWIAERKDVLYAFFFLTSLISYILYRDLDQKKYYYLALLLFLFSLLSKPMAISLPLVLILIDYYRKRWNLKDKIPFFAFSVLFGIIAILAKQATGGLVVPEPPLSLMNLFILSYRVLFYYLPRVFLLFNFTRLFPHASFIPEHLQESFTLLPFSFLISPLLLILLLGGLFLLFRKKIKVMFGLLFFFIVIAPGILFIQVGYFADRYAYLPVVGIFYLFAEGTVWFYQDKVKNNKLFSKLFIVLLVVLILTTLNITWRRISIWRDNLFLNNEACRLFPGFYESFMNRGNVYKQRKEYLKALEDYNKALSMEPDSSKVLGNRGSLYHEMEEHHLAVIDLRRAVKIDPAKHKAFNNLGNSLGQVGKLKEALQAYSSAISVGPERAIYYHNRGNTYLHMGRDHKAIADFSKALDLDPKLKETYFKRGEAYFKLGKYSKALSDTRKAQQLGFIVDPVIIELLEKKINVY
ncbi:MAG: tetratricopeptide repeat protein [Candidatus Margulisiibacteriota bacterium]|nr:tetratricopeptide repeat protein [Candidatus Margulisiibacteriota bacterium]